MSRKRLIFSVDFDGTLCSENWPSIGKPNLNLIEFLKKRKKSGDILILNTCREGKELGEAVSWCHEFGLDFNAVNENCREIKEAWGDGYRKIFANVYIDDHNMTESEIRKYGLKLPFVSE